MTRQYKVLYRAGTEYRTVEGEVLSSEFGIAGLQEALTTLGADLWEYAGVYDSNIILTRLWEDEESEEPKGYLGRRPEELEPYAE